MTITVAISEGANPAPSPALERHPLQRWLRRNDRTLTWLAEATGYTIEHLSNVSNRHRPATRRLRLACTAACGCSESDLFHPASAADAPSA